MQKNVDKLKISVVVPVYNNVRFLPGAVESLLGQTYKNTEIILVDDGSTDGSSQLCDEYAEKNPRIIAIHQLNRGVSVARNTGLERATGSLITFCDGDDIADSDWLEFLYRQMVENNSDMSCCALRMIVNNTAHSNETGAKKLWNSDGYIEALLKKQVPVGVYNNLFKAEFIKDIKFPEGYRFNEDKYFILLAALNAEKISFQNVSKYQYFRREGSSTTVTFSEKFFDSIRLAEKTLEIIKEKKPHLTEVATVNLLAVNIRVYKLMHIRKGLKTFKNEAQQILSYIKSFEKALAKRYLDKKDYIRFVTIRTSKNAFSLMVKFLDKR